MVGIRIFIFQTAAEKPLAVFFLSSVFLDDLKKIFLKPQRKEEEERKRIIT
jgi:hypothetical protein